jgi:hypothetical protein
MRLKRIKLPIHEKDFRPTSSTYLAKIDKQWQTGKFWAQWYGWVFDTDLMSHQVSYYVGGYSDPTWQALYEIVEGRSKKSRDWKKESKRKKSDDD